MYADLMTISQVARELGISSRALRYYEEKGLIVSVRASESQKRRYQNEEIMKIKHINALRSLGFSIDRIHRMLLENKDLAVTIEKQKDDICSEIKEVEQQIQKLEQAQTIIREEEQLSDENEQKLRELQETIAYAAGECIMDHHISELNQYLSRATVKLFDGNVNLDFLVCQFEKKYGAYQKIQSVEILDHKAEVWMWMEKSKDTVSISFVFHRKYITSVRIGGAEVIGTYGKE